jgi:uncharacterized oligopeptide transporter (OPT) family protein
MALGARLKVCRARHDQGEEQEDMDIKTFLGGSPMGVLVRLLVLSLVVGVILSALGITPQNFFFQINVLLQRIYDLGFGAFQSIVEYLVLGAMVVVPIWLIARLLKTARRPDGTS